MVTIAVLLNIIGAVGLFYLGLRPWYVSQREPRILNDFTQTPWLDWAFYSRTTVLLEPGNNLTGQVKITYLNQLPYQNAPPYFYLLVYSQFVYDNAQVGFRGHVFRSMPDDANTSSSDSITIPFTIVNIGEKSEHYFVVIPEQVWTKIEVDFTVGSVVVCSLPVVFMGTLALVSTAILGIDQLNGFLGRGRKQESVPQYVG